MATYMFIALDEERETIKCHLLVQTDSPEEAVAIAKERKRFSENPDARWFMFTGQEIKDEH